MPAEPNTTDRQPKDSRCATRWPILLVHGVAFKHAERTRYWGRLPALLRQHGARVYISEQDAWGSIESNARQLQAKLLEVLATEKAEKVNIIAHSKGGLDSRRLAAFPGIGEHIASLTTISSPHHGIKALNWVNRLPETVLKLASSPTDILLILAGEERPSLLPALASMSAEAMVGFNDDFPPPEGYLVQSYAAVQKRMLNDISFLHTAPLISLIDGDNDGLIPLASADFGEYRGIMNEQGAIGLSHREITDMSFIPYPKRLKSRDGFDILGWWVELVAELKDRGL